MIRSHRLHRKDTELPSQRARQIALQIPQMHVLKIFGIDLPFACPNSYISSPGIDLLKTQYRERIPLEEAPVSGLSGGGVFSKQKLHSIHSGHLDILYYNNPVRLSVEVPLFVHKTWLEKTIQLAHEENEILNGFKKGSAARFCFHRPALIRNVNSYRAISYKSNSFDSAKRLVSGFPLKPLESMHNKVRASQTASGCKHPFFDAIRTKIKHHQLISSTYCF